MSDIKKVRDYQKSRQPKPPISKSAHRANCEDIVDNLLMPIIEKMRKTPETIQPVAESFEDLLFEMRNGVKRQPYIMQAGGRRLAVCDDVVTELEYQPTIIESGDSEKNLPAELTKTLTGGAKLSGESTILTAEDLAILETLK
jgi:hypothetical protein